MANNKLYFDESFTPELKYMNDLEYRWYFDKWEFHELGIPAPVTDINAKAAGWVACRYSKHKEVPLIYGVYRNEKSMQQNQKLFFGGIISLEDWEKALDTEDAFERGLYILDHAAYGPDTFFNTHQLLRKIMPEDLVVDYVKI